MAGSSLESVTVRWRTIALALCLAVSAVIVVGLVAAGEPAREAVRATAHGEALDALRTRVKIDSIQPMVVAYDRKLTNPAGDMYAVFFVDHVKFQYPPSSLLPFDLLPRSWTAFDGKVTPKLRSLWTALSFLAVLLTALAAALILELRAAQLDGGDAAAILKRPPWLGLALSLALGLSFYPLIKGHYHGQVQVFLGCLAAFALLFNVLGREALAAVCLGLCALVKPQWGVVVVWALLRRRWRFAGIFGAVLAVGLAISIARFGLRDHLRYLDVLREIGSTGEVYWPNQSFNGLLNRLLGNGDPVVFQAYAFPPRNAVVGVLTMLSSLALLALALWPGRRGTRRSDDLPLALAAATMASPVAWEHHYGAFLPVLAATVPDLARFRPLGRATAPLLAFAYVAIASVFLRPELLFANRAIGLLGSHLFYGALTLFALLFALRAKTPSAGTS
jgi:alpha-1,2-mannosyltransferase